MLTEDEEIELYELLKEEEKDLSRTSHLRFIEHTWMKSKDDPFIAGFHTKKICEEIDNAFEKYRNGLSTDLLISVHHRSGKALEINTPIPTPEGFKKIIDICPGDKVFDENGDITEVMAKSEIFRNRKCYNVKTVDGENIIADGEHIWRTRQCRHQNKYINHTTKWLAERTGKLNSKIKMQRAIKTTEKILPIMPYTFGAWLGDGDSARNAITCSYSDLEIIENIRRDGYSIKEWKSSNKNTGHYQIGGGDYSQNKRKTSLIITLRKMNVIKNKHIPMKYKRASIKQRIELLQGLIDTDGHVAKNGYVEFTNKNKQLSYDVYELVCSLGIKCSISEGNATIDGRFISKKYRVKFYMKNCARLKRKAIFTRDATSFRGRYIKVSECDRHDTVCIQVTNKSGLFLCGKSFLITHNSDLVSRYLGAHFLGEFPDAEVMQTSYQADLAHRFSAFGRNLFRSYKYYRLYPRIKLSKESNAKNYWEITNSEGEPLGGKLFATGLTSGLTGNGWNLGILDDYFAGRKEAESKVQRDNAWEAFTNDYMTRRAPVSINIVLATQWHWDDINGRIKNEMQKNPNFPQFKILSFPAKAKDYLGEGEYPNEYLFEERYSKKWYLGQYATLGKYSAAALLDCDPQFREGGRFNIDNIIWDDIMPDQFESQWYRVWDLAHTSKQRSGDDPDYTSGTLLTFVEKPGDPVPHLYVKHVARTREGAVKRDSFIKMHARKDGNFVKQAIENSIDAKDAYEYIQNAIPDISWTKIELDGDKGVRATPLEPIFEAKGHVHVCKGDWNDDWIDEIIRFDGLGKTHDDQVDNLSGGYAIMISDKMRISEVTKAGLAARHRR